MLFNINAKKISILLLFFLLNYSPSWASNIQEIKKKNANTSNIPVLLFWESVNNPNLHNLARALSLGVSPNSTNQYGYTALYYAIDKNHPDMFRLLIEYGADINYVNGEHITPLIFAATSSRNWAIKELISLGAKIDSQDKAGMTALMKVIMKNNVLSLRMLSEAGADYSITDYSGRNALDFAKDARDPSLFMLAKRYAKRE